MTYLFPLLAWLILRKRWPADPMGLRFVLAAVGLHVLILIALIVLIAAGAGAAILITNNDEPKKREAKHGKADKKGGKHKQGDGGKDKPAGPVTLDLKLHEPVEVCLLGGAGGALIDGQVLPAGDREHFERKEFQLRFPSGFAGDQLTVKVGGKKRLLPKVDGPAAYKITAPQHVRTLKPPGKSCP